MKLVICLGLVATVLMASGCGVDEEKFTYQYNVNGCDTGEHSFESKDAYCSALKDDALNKGCAARMRQSRFQSECS
jgi:hypothetical protein